MKKNSEFERIISDADKQSDRTQGSEEASSTADSHPDQQSENENMIYVCSKCYFQSRRENILKEHIKIDHPPSTTRRIYVCDICEFKCGSQTDFKKHCNESHKDTKYPCDYCGTKLNSLASLDSHIQMFHKKKPEQCLRCDSTFSSSDNLKRHMEYKHRVFPDYEEDMSVPNRSYTYSYEEKAANGFCRNWNNSTCPYEDACKFLHKESPHCRHQSRCRNISSCRFFHEEQQPQGFQYRQDDFPPPSWSSQSRRRSQ